MKAAGVDDDPDALCVAVTFRTLASTWDDTSGISRQCS